MKKLMVLAVAALIGAPQAFAAEGPMGEVSAYLVNSQLDVEGAGEDHGLGFGIGGWLSVTGPFFGHLEYQTVDLDNADLESLRLGGGIYHQLNPQFAVLGKAEFVDLGSDVDEDGFGLHGGLLFSPTQQITVVGTVGHLSLNETEGAEINLGAGYRFTKEWGAFVDWREYLGSANSSRNFEISELRGGVSFMFGSM